MFPGKHVWAESVAFSGLAPSVGWLLDRTDTFVLNRGGGAPWLALAPLLVALQHGVGPGLLSGALLSAGASWMVGTAEAANLALASLVCAALAGLFRDHWNRRKAQLERSANESEAQLERLSRSYRLLIHSHGELESRVATTGSGAASLAEALDATEEVMGATNDLAARGSMLLSLLTTHADVLAASLWHARGARLAAAPFADCGTRVSISECHGSVVLQRTLATGAPRSVATPDALVDDAVVIAAIPLSTSAGETIGVLAIHEMPFSSFNLEALQRIEAICARATCLLLPGATTKLPEAARLRSAGPSGAARPRAQPRPQGKAPHPPPPAGALSPLRNQPQS